MLSSQYSLYFSVVWNCSSLFKRNHHLNVSLCARKIAVTLLIPEFCYNKKPYANSKKILEQAWHFMVGRGREEERKREKNPKKQNKETIPSNNLHKKVISSSLPMTAQMAKIS